MPIGKRALAWIDKYLAEVRPEFESHYGRGEIFLTYTGREFSGTAVSKIVRGYIVCADIAKAGSCHLFRHAMATHMLDGGADVRDVQEMLGHKSLDTTQIYTHVSIRKLQQVHAQSHPAKNERPKPDSPGRRAQTF